MTHDELLELIAANEEFYGDGTNRTPSWSALREVVELHKPYQGYVEEELVCQLCWSNQWAVIYPCLTIKAIEGQLK